MTRAPLSLRQSTSKPLATRDRAPLLPPHDACSGIKTVLWAPSSAVPSFFRCRATIACIVLPLTRAQHWCSGFEAALSFVLNANRDLDQVLHKLRFNRNRSLLTPRLQVSEATDRCEQLREALAKCETRG